MRRKTNQILRQLFFVLALTLICNASQATIEILDIMVLYTPEATQVSGYDPEARIVSLVEYANKAYQLSGMNYQLRLVHMQQYDQANSSSVSPSALYALSADSSVKQLRDQYGADFVSLVTKRSESGNGYLCGFAWLVSGTEGRLYDGSNEYAFSVVAADCGFNVFVHEIGHNMGLNHSLEKWGSVGGVFDFGRGYGVDNLFATIMSYGFLYGVYGNLQQFSNPEILCKNMQCGLDRNRPDGADSVFAVNQIASQLAEFTPTMVDATNIGSNSDMIDEDVDDNSGEGNSSDDGTGGDDKIVENLIINGDIEEKKNGWYKYGPSRLKLAREANSGKYSLLIQRRSTRRSHNYSQYGARQSLLGILTNGHTYSFSAWIKFEGSSAVEDSQTAKAQLYYSDNTGDNWQTIALQNLVGKGEWHQFSDQFNFYANGQIKRLELVISGPNSAAFQLDDVEIRRQY